MLTLANLILRLAFLLWLALSSASSVRGQPASQASPSTIRMNERLEKIIQETDPLKNLFMNRERAELFGRWLAAPTNRADIPDLQSRYAIELLNAGRAPEAIQAFDSLDRLFRANPGMMDSRGLALLRVYRGLSYLRLGEEENCLVGHNADFCLFPMCGTGVHQKPRGSRAALEILTDHLRKSPSDVKGRWLLNIAYMTLGEYPGQVPAPWRIDPKLFESEYDIKRFPDVAPAAGLDVDGLAGGCIVEDFDGDGYLDVMVSSWGVRDQLRLFHSNADGTFMEVTEKAGLIGEWGGLNMMQTDYNNDGHPDVLILRGAWMGEAGHYPNSLLRNNGDGTFTDVTEEAGLLSFHPTQTATWFDYNNDGWIDLFIGNETFGTEIHPCELYRNNGNGTFTECAVRAGVANIGFVKAVASGDYNNDGRPDLYLSRRSQPNVLYRNDGPRGPENGPAADWQFSDVSVSAGVTEPVLSFPAWFWDYDNDGWLDLFVCGYWIKSVGDVAADYLGLPHQGTQPRLYHNNGNGTFSDVTRSARLWKVIHAMGANFGDLDNDGFLDFYGATGDPDMSTLIPNRMFRNAEGQFFQEVTTAGGFGHLQKGHAVSFGDLDNDGDQDVYEVIGGAYSGDHHRSVLFENPGHGHHWITLKLEGVQSNRAALGARIKVVVQTEQGERAIYKTVSTGGSFGASPLRQEIGLGSARAIQAVEMFWPRTGQTQILKGLALDRFYRVREGDAAAVPVELKTFKLAPRPHQVSQVDVGGSKESSH